MSAVIAGETLSATMELAAEVTRAGSSGATAAVACSGNSTVKIPQARAVVARGSVPLWT